MKTLSIWTVFILGPLLLASNTWAGETIEMTRVAAANPCSMKNNPCAMKKHNPCNPCGKKMANPCNPCGKMMKNPCNPCAGKADRIDAKLVIRPANKKTYTGPSRAKLVEHGRKLFKDTSLSSNGLSCNSCHSTNNLFNASFAKPYPHPVSMAKERAGIGSKLNADEFVQFCMLAPMATQPLPWESKTLAALAAYVTDTKQPAFVKWAAKNPCALKKVAAANPCGKKMNPCNPCAKKIHNPCAMKMKNPCAKKIHNPCAMKMKNPCAKR